MHRYNLKLRIGGSVMNEIRKKNASAAEVMILQKLHGNDAIIDLQELPNDKTEHYGERKRLISVYCSDSDARSRFTIAKFERMFGPEHTDLPTRLPELARAAKAAEAVKAAGGAPPKPQGKTEKGAEVDLTQMAG